MSGKKSIIRSKEPTMSEVFGLFLAHKVACGISAMTAKSYRQHFSAVKRFLDTEVGISRVTREAVTHAVAEMADTSLSRNSIRSYTATLMSFFSWCREEGYSEVEVKLFKGEETVPELYTKAELQRLLRKPKPNATFAEIRDWAIINILINNGIRAATVRSIMVGDVRLSDSVILLRKTKTRKTFSVPLSPSLVQVLKTYMRIRKGSRTDYLFCNVSGEQMSDSCLRSAVQTYNRSRGVMKHGIHAFRHTFARMYLVECNGNALKLQKLLGHSTLKMTQHYVQLFDSDIVNDFQVVSPLEALKKKE